MQNHVLYISYTNLYRISQSGKVAVTTLRTSTGSESSTGTGTYSTVLNGYLIFCRIPNSVKKPTFDLTTLNFGAPVFVLVPRFF
jgi:hypothetical protein